MEKFKSQLDFSDSAFANIKKSPGNIVDSPGRSAFGNIVDSPRDSYFVKYHTQKPRVPVKRPKVWGGESNVYDEAPQSTSPWAVERKVLTRSPGSYNRFFGHDRRVQTGMIEDLPWYMKGEGGGMLGRRRAEVEGINPQEMYGLAAPSIRKTTEGLMSGIEKDAAARNLSPAMVALARRGLLKGELEGLGSAAGQAAAGAYGIRESSRAGLAGMEVSLGRDEMAGRRGVTRSQIPLEQQSRTFARQDKLQRESQDRISQFWSSYNEF